MKRLVSSVAALLEDFWLTPRKASRSRCVSRSIVTVLEYAEEFYSRNQKLHTASSARAHERRCDPNLFDGRQKHVHKDIEALEIARLLRHFLDICMVYQQKHDISKTTTFRTEFGGIFIPCCLVGQLQEKHLAVLDLQ